MLRLIVVAALLLATPATAGTRLFGFYGLGGQWTSEGIDQIAEQARNISGVTHIAIYNSNDWDVRRAISDIDAVPSSDKVVLFSYSCGVNASTNIAASVHRRVNTIAGIQQSKWCGGTDLFANVGYGQVTYGGAETFGLGSKQLSAGAGFTGKILNIYRPERHGYADTDPEYQADVLRAISLTAHGRPQRVRCGQHVCVIVRRHGEAP